MEVAVGCPGMEHLLLTARDGGGCTKYSHCCLLLTGLRVGKRMCGGGRAVSPPTDLALRSRSRRDQMTLSK